MLRVRGRHQARPGLRARRWRSRASPASTRLNPARSPASALPPLPAAGLPRRRSCATEPARDQPQPALPSVDRRRHFSCRQPGAVLLLRQRRHARLSNSDGFGLDLQAADHPPTASARRTAEHGFDPAWEPVMRGWRNPLTCCGRIRRCRPVRAQFIILHRAAALDHQTQFIAGSSSRISGMVEGRRRSDQVATSRPLFLDHFDKLPP